MSTEPVFRNVVIETFNRRFLTQNGVPTLAVSVRAVAPCGCCCFMGRRIDNGEVATGASACSPEHHPVIDDFQEKFRASLDNPTDRLLIDVIAEILESSWVAYGSMV